MYKQLGCAIAFQAAKDYFNTDKYGKRAIINDLSTPYMECVTDGLSLLLVEQLKRNPKEVAKRIRIWEEN